MPNKRTTERARQDRRQGKSASSQAGEFVREEIHKIRHGEHGARSPEQAIAIGLSEARRAGVKLPPPKKGRASAETRRKARHENEVGQGKRQVTHRPRVARAVKKVLKQESTASASSAALSRHARVAAGRRTASERSASARTAARTKGAAGRSAAAQKAARTRARHGG